MSAVMERGRSRTAETKVRKDTIINLRVPRQTRELIDAAADAIGKTRTEFVLESARQHAVDVLLDQRLFVLDPAQHEEFLRVLDNPPLPNKALKKLLSSKAPWER